MPNISDEERKKIVLNALPSDGSSRGNRALVRQLNWGQDIYFKIRDELVSEEKIQIGRGRGGSIRLAKPGTEGAGTSISASTRRKSNRATERKLYPEFLNSLRTWAAAESWTDHLIEQIADQGSKRTGGRFTRLDFVVVGIKKIRIHTWRGARRRNI